MKKPLIVHPFLFAISPVLFLFSHNLGQVQYSDILMPLVIVTGFALILLWFSGVIIKDRMKAGIIVSIFLMLVFSYGHVLSLMKSWWPLGTFRQRYIIITWMLLFAWSAYKTARTERELFNVSSILNVFAGVILVMSLFNIVMYPLSNTPNLMDARFTESNNLETTVTDSGAAEQRLDIYYIILDRYSNNSTLKEVYNYDNSEFIDHLTEKGFYVASKSISNYPVTPLSLASSLNMEYVNYLGDRIGKKVNNWLPVYAMLQDYKVWKYLKSKGYKYIHFGSSWQPTRSNKNADINYNVNVIPEFLMLLYRNTIFSPIGVEFGILDERRQKWKRIMYDFEKLAEIPKMEEPTFVFAHLLIPHGPYVFDRNGNFLSEKEVKVKSHKENYLEQLIFVNQKIKELVDVLLSSPEPPIIIIQADEGSYPERLRADTDKFNWKHASDLELREKYRILSSYHLPNVSREGLYSSITPVNSFRLIFNLYFGTQFELLPDESYAYINNQQIYNFINITDKVKFD